MGNKAEEIIIPENAGIFRIVFLYVGQGDSTLLVLPSGETYEYMLIDCNQDNLLGGIDLPLMLKDLTDNLHYFVNTHPHKDHMSGIKRIATTVNIGEIWHSGHRPGGKNKDIFKEFEEVMDSLEEECVKTLRGTQDTLQIGDVNYNVLSPAEYVADDIENEKPEDRYARIHEQCSVLRFGYGEEEKQILITGDADLDAWKNHITGYHKERLPATVLSAPHHGSRSFFKKDEEDDPYKDHLEAIGASYLIISAPKQEESEHEHPHDDALELYNEFFDEELVYHLGADRQCAIVDIGEDGSIEVNWDDELVKEYGTDGGDGKNQKKVGRKPPLVVIPESPRRAWRNGSNRDYRGR